MDQPGQAHQGAVADQLAAFIPDLEEDVERPQDQPVRDQGVVAYAHIEGRQQGQQCSAGKRRPRPRRMANDKPVGDIVVQDDAGQEPPADKLEMLRQDAAQPAHGDRHQRVGVGVKEAQAGWVGQQGLVIEWPSQRRLAIGVPSKEMLTPIAIQQPADACRVKD
jgi:hypothetical protein